MLYRTEKAEAYLIERQNIVIILVQHIHDALQVLTGEIETNRLDELLKVNASESSASYELKGESRASGRLGCPFQD
jgi:hypothetical protein